MSTGSWLAALAILPVLVCGAPVKADGAVGVTVLGVPQGGRDLAVTLWYPALPGGTPVLVGDNAVFEGIAAQQDAPMAAGSWPLVLISHGGLRSAPNQDAWIASHLAGEGYLAASVQGPRLGPRDAGKAVAEIRQRPADLSAALSALVGDPALSEHIDPERVAAIGFFLGGTSVLSLAGGRLDAEAFMRSCEPDGHGLDCGWFEANGIDLRSADVAALTGPSLDRRVGMAILVDPEYGASFSGESLAEIAIRVEVVNLGRTETVLPGLDGSMLGAASPRISYTVLPDATRFDAFSLCKPKGAAILAEEEGDDSMCRDATPESRSTIHRQLAALILDRLREAAFPAAR